MLVIKRKGTVFMTYCCLPYMVRTTEAAWVKSARTRLQSPALVFVYLCG